MSIRIFLSAAVLTIASVQASATGVEGLWASPPNEETKGHIEVDIMACENDSSMTCGVIKSYFKNGVPTESDIVGKPIIEKMKSAGDNIWKGGTIWAPDDDKTYTAKMELLDENTLKVSGWCIALYLPRSRVGSRTKLI